MVSIQLPAPLRRLVVEQESILLEACTVGQAVEALCSRHEQLKDRLLKPNGKLRPSVAVFVNNSQPAARPETALKDGDTLVLVQPVGGG
jgi:molybdopterin converting factor small subunit